MAKDIHLFTKRQAVVTLASVIRASRAGRAMTVDEPVAREVEFDIVVIVRHTVGGREYAHRP